MGLGGSSDAWWRLLPRLPPTVRAITLDNRGTGGSSAVEGRLTLEGMVADVRAVMDHAGIERAHVCGLSMGGMIAQHLALDHRDRVASLLLGCTTPVSRRGVPPWRLIGAGALRPLLGAERTWELLAGTLYAQRTRHDHPARIEEDGRVREEDPVAPRTITAQLLAVAAHDTEGRLAELAGLPVTVFHGLEDALVAPARAREIAAAVPGARLHLLTDCGHQMTTEAEGEVAELVLGHLVEHAGLRVGYSE